MLPPLSVALRCGDTDDRRSIVSLRARRQSRELLVKGDFEAYTPPSLGAPGWVSDSSRQVPAKSETHQPHAGRQNGACWSTTNLNCGMYQEVTAPAAGEYAFTVYANANKTGGLVGVGVNGVTVASAKVIVRGFGNYAPYTMTFSALPGDTISRVDVFAGKPRLRRD